MKHLPLKNTSYHSIIALYKEWLQTLGYAASTAYGLPNLLQELLHYLESQNVYEINQLSPQHLNAYYHYISHRSNTRFGGGLSNTSINQHRRMLVSFTNYLRQSGRMVMPALGIHTLDERKEKLNILTEQEIKLLFKATYTIDERLQGNNIHLGERDRAMLAVFYGCGLRRGEATALNIEDLRSDKQELHVRKGKNYKQRLVPVGTQYLQYIEEYLYNSRYQLLQSRNSPAFFISRIGKRMSHVTLNKRLQIITKHTGNEALINKKPTLHTLRHSIATHLLQSGISIEQIAKFLGHSSLESTQIYTHLHLT